MADNLAEEQTDELKGEDLDATLANALKDIESRDSDNSDEGEGNEQDTGNEVYTEDAGASKGDGDGKDGKPSGDTGEHLRDSGDAEGSSDDDSQQESVSVQDKERTEVGPRRPPGSWSPKGKAEFAKLPEHIQDEVLKRENDFEKGFEKYKEKAQIGERMRQVIQPYEPFLRAKGARPEQTVASMLNTAYVLENGNEQQKLQALAQTAQQYGVDLSQLTQNEQPSDDNQMTQYIKQLEQKVNQLENNFQTQTQAAQQQSMSEAYGSIDAFRNEVDEHGNVKNVHFDQVRDDMADMIEAAEKSGRKLTLQDAYDAAIWARPDIRETLLDEKRKQLEEARKSDAAQKAADAKKRASVNVPATGSYIASESARTGSIDETLRAKMAEIQARDE